MSLDRERQLVPRDTGAVVADPDQRCAAAGGDHLDTARAGVDGVLDQLLDHARRTLDHLAGGDAVDHVLAEAADRHEHGSFPGANSDGFAAAGKGHA